MWILVTHFSIASGDALKHRDSRRDRISLAKVSPWIWIFVGCTCSKIILDRTSSRNVSPPFWIPILEHRRMIRKLGNDSMSSLNRFSNIARELSYCEESDFGIYRAMKDTYHLLCFTNSHQNRQQWTRNGVQTFLIIINLRGTTGDNFQNFSTGRCVISVRTDRFSQS